MWKERLGYGGREACSGGSGLIVVGVTLLDWN